MGEDDGPGRPPGTAPLPDWWWGLGLGRRRVVSAVVALLVVALVIGAASRVLGDGGPARTAAERFVAGLPDDQVALWDAVAECESEGDWASRNDPFYGGLQFTIDSWQAVGGLGRADQVPREEQIMRAESLLDDQGWAAWPDCSAQLGLG